MLAKALLMVSSAVFAATGLAYLAVPGLALSIVGIPSSPTSDFLLRTESVPLLFGAAMTWTMRDGGQAEQRIALGALAGYYVLSSVIDLAALRPGCRRRRVATECGGSHRHRNDLRGCGGVGPAPIQKDSRSIGARNANPYVLQLPALPRYRRA